MGLSTSAFCPLLFVAPVMLQLHIMLMLISMLTDLVVGQHDANSTIDKITWTHKVWWRMFAISFVEVALKNAHFIIHFYLIVLSCVVGVLFSGVHARECELYAHLFVHKSFIKYFHGLHLHGIILGITYSCISIN